MADTLVPNNPYVGPRSIKTGEAFFGRAREIRALSALLSAERIVLLHSPSGAGKSSLIQAGLIPRMTERFSVFPVVRVNLEVPEEVRATPGLNRYVLSTLLSLEEGLPLEKRLPLAELASLSPDAYLEKRILPNGPLENCLLLFDQFEEVLTVSPTDALAKQEFFEQLGESLQNRRRWALFAIREDYMGGLAPYVRAIPNRLNVTFRLGLLGPDAAKVAIQQPAKNKEVDFTDEAAAKLVDDLRCIQVQQPDGSFVSEQGPDVEPVQLQVVCFNLWQSHAADDKIIDEGDLQRVGSVDQALASYYANSLRLVAGNARVEERILRQWFDEHLITPEGIRSQVLKGAEFTEGLPNIVLRLLQDTHLIRGETRAGKTWYELSHDRLVKPVRQDNNAWFEHNLSLLQRQAVLWDQQGRSEGLLLRGKAFEQAEKEINSLPLTSDEQAFLDACQKLRKSEQRDRRQRQFIISGLAASLIFLAVAIYFGISANSATQEARLQRAVAVTKASVAATAENNAQIARQDALAQAKLASAGDLVAFSIANLTLDPELSLHLALKSLDAAYTIRAEDALRRVLLSPTVQLTLHGHTGAVYSVAYDTTGQRLVTASADGTARIWDAMSGRELIALRGHVGAVNAAVFSPDGQLIATAGADKTARIWDAKTGQQLRSLATHADAVNSVAFSPDGQQLVTASNDKTARIWQVASGSEVYEFKLTAAVLSAIFSPDGRLIATGGHDQLITIWDAASHEALKSLSNSSESVTTLAFSPDSQSILTNWLYNARRLDIQSESLTTEYAGGHTWYVTGVTFSPDGKQLVTVSRDHTASLWNTESGTLIDVLRGHRGIVYAAAFNPDSSQLATASEDQTVRLWNIGEWRKRILIGYTGFLVRAVYSVDGRQIATTGNDGMIRVWDAQSGYELKAWQYPGYIANRIHFSPDDRQLITSSDDGTWRIWDIATGAELGQPHYSSSVVSDARFSRDGTHILTTGRDGVGRIWDSVTQQQRVLLQGDGNGIWTGAFSPDGRLVVTSGSGAPRIWDARSGQTLKVLSGHSDLVVSALFDSKGERVVTASVDGSARIWDVNTGKTLHILIGHTSEVTDASFSPDGQYIATASRDGTVILWNAETGDELIQLFGHKRDVFSVEFSPDGRYLLTASLDGTARVYQVYFEDVLALARAIQSPRALACAERVKYLHEKIECPTPAP